MKKILIILLLSLTAFFFTCKPSNLVDTDNNKNVDGSIIKYRLHTDVEPPSAGTIARSILGTRPVVTNDDSYVANSLLCFIANPAVNYIFDHWEGDFSGTNNSGVVILDREKYVKAVFVLDPNCTVINDDFETVGIIDGQLFSTKYNYDLGSFDGSQHDTQLPYVQSNVVHGGNYAVQMDEIPGGSTEVKLSVNVSQPALLSFYYKMNTEDSVLYFFMDNSLKFQKSVMTDWIKYTIFIDTPGNYELWWYMQSGSGSNDHVWLDDLTIIDRTYNQPSLNVTVDPPEAGSVNITSGTYNYYEEVTLIPTSNTGYYFYQWEDSNGNPLSADNPYNLLMNDNKDIVAKFMRPTPTNGAFKIVNSWGSDWGDNGTYWMTFEAAKKVGLQFYSTQSKERITPKAVVRFKIDHDYSRDCEISVLVDNKVKSLPGTGSQIGYLPFPAHEITMDISEFYYLLNDNEVIIKIADKNDHNEYTTVNELKLWIWDESEYGDGNTPDLVENQFPNEIVDNEIKSYTFSNHIGNLSLSRNLGDNDFHNLKIITSKPTESQLIKMKAKLGTYKDGVNYDNIVDGIYHTGLVPPTEEEWDIIAKSNIMITGIEGASRNGRLEEIDYSEDIYFPPIGDQGSKGSCQHFSSIYYIHTYNMAKENNWDLSGCKWENGHHGYPSVAYQDKIMSPGFSYDIFDTSKLVRNLGICTWKTYPYSDLRPREWPTRKAFQEAPNYKCYYDEPLVGFYLLSIEDDSDIEIALQLLEDGYLLSISVASGDYDTLDDGNGNFVWTDDELATNWVNSDRDHANTIVGFKRNFDPLNP